MGHGIEQVCRVWNVTVQLRYMKLRGVVYRVVQMVLLGSIIAFLKVSREDSGQVTFLFVVACVCLSTTMLVFLVNLLSLYLRHQSRRHTHQVQEQQQSSFRRASILEAIHDGVALLFLLTGALVILVPPSPTNLVAAAAVVTVVLVFVLALQCLENVQRGCHPCQPFQPPQHQQDDQETLDGMEMQDRPRRRYTTNVTRGRPGRWSKLRKYNVSPPIAMTPMSNFPSSPTSSPLLDSPGPSTAPRSSSVRPSSPRFPHHSETLSGFSLTDDVVLNDAYKHPINASGPVGSPLALTYPPGPSPFPYSKPGEVTLNPNYSVPPSDSISTTYATPFNASPYDNLKANPTISTIYATPYHGYHPSHHTPHEHTTTTLPDTTDLGACAPVHVNLPKYFPTTTTTTAIIPTPGTTLPNTTGLAAHRPVYVIPTPPTTTTTSTIHSTEHCPVYANLPMCSATSTTPATIMPLAIDFVGHQPINLPTRSTTTSNVAQHGPVYANLPTCTTTTTTDRAHHEPDYVHLSSCSSIPITTTTSTTTDQDPVYANLPLHTTTTTTTMGVPAHEPLYANLPRATTIDDPDTLDFCFPVTDL